MALLPYLTMELPLKTKSILASALLVGISLSFSVAKAEQKSLLSTVTAQQANQKFFPFSQRDPISINLSDDNFVSICDTNTSSCLKVKIPSEEIINRIVAAPLIKASRASWIALGTSDIFVCAVPVAGTKATCASVGVKSNAAIDISFGRKGLVPTFTFHGAKHSQDEVAAYAKAFNVAVIRTSNKVGAALPSGDASDDGIMMPMEEDNPSIEVPGSAPIGGGGGGVVTTPVGGGGDQGGGGGTDPGAGGGEGSDDCTCGLTEEQKLELLRKCLAAADYNYDYRYTPACQRNFNEGTPERAWCWAAAVDQYAADRQFCRDYYR